MLLGKENRMKLKAAIYCRLSKEDIDKASSDQESESIVNQTLMLLDFVEQKGFELYDIYKDDDYSGLYDDRPGFERLIKDAEDGKFNIVIAKSQSRFTRNMEHLERYIHHDFPLWGIRFIGMVDNADTEVKGNKKARQINGLVNEWYCEDLSESIKASYRIKQKNGQFLGSSTPYGYVKDPKDNHHLIPDPYAANVVKRIFHMYLSGIGKAQIGQILTKEGILIPTEYKRQVLKINYHNAMQKYGDDCRWSFQTIHGILKNEVYIGNLIQNKCRKKSYKDKSKKAVPQEEWIRVNNTHEPIISKEIFDRVQEQLKERSRKVNIVALNENLFARRLFCGDCGKPFTVCYSKRNKRGERYRKYICSEYKQWGNKYCTSHSIREDVLEEIVLKDLKNHASMILTEESKNMLNEFRCISSFNNQSFNIKKIKEELQKVENYKVQAFENFVDGLLNKNEYIKLKEKYESDEKKLQVDLQNYGGDVCENIEKTQFEKWLSNFTNDFNVEKLTREMVLNLINSIYIFEDKRIQINYRFEFAEKKIG